MDDDDAHDAAAVSPKTLAQSINAAIADCEVEIDDSDIKHLPTIKAMFAELDGLKRQLAGLVQKDQPARRKTETSITTTVRYSPI